MNLINILTQSPICMCIMRNPFPVGSFSKWKCTLTACICFSSIAKELHILNNLYTGMTVFDLFTTKKTAITPLHDHSPQHHIRPLLEQSVHYFTVPVVVAVVVEHCNDSFLPCRGFTLCFSHQRK